MSLDTLDVKHPIKDNVQEGLAQKITADLDVNILQLHDFRNGPASFEDYVRNIDDKVNCKIAAGMKKAVHLLVDKFDILLQNRLKFVLAKHVKDEVDERMHILRQLSQANKLLCAKCTALPRRDPAKPKNCTNCTTDQKQKSPTVRQIRTKVQERIDRSIEHHHQRLKSPRTRGDKGGKYPYKSPNRFFESQESSIRSVEDLQYSMETSPANILTSSNQHKLQSPIADASFCSSDKAPRRGKGASAERRAPPNQGTARDRCTKKLVNIKIQPKETKGREAKQEAPKAPRLANLSCLHSKPRASLAGAPKSSRLPNDAAQAKRPRDAKAKRNASRASAAESQARPSIVKKTNDALKLRQEEYVEKVPIGYPMELKDDLLDSRLKWLNNTQQVSALFDEVEEIYKEQDPIDESLGLRKQHNGFINNYSVVRVKKRAKRKFFFYLRAKLPEQNSIFEVSPVQLMSQLRKQERADAIRVIDESYHQKNPNVMVPQSSNSSSRVKISGSGSTRKADQTARNSILSQEDTSINNEYKAQITATQAKLTYTDSRKYSDSENVGGLPSGQPVKRKPDQIFKHAFQQEKKYQAKSIAGSPEHAPHDHNKTSEQASPDKWVVLDQSSQDALKDIKLAQSFEKSVDQQISLDQSLLSPRKSQLNRPEQKLALAGPGDNAAAISPREYPLHPVYAPEEHHKLQHALIQQQSPEKIHFEAIEQRPEEQGVKLQLCQVASEQCSPAAQEHEGQSAAEGPAPGAGSGEPSSDGPARQNKQTPRRSPARQGQRQALEREELISESLPESPQKVPQQNELRELDRGTPFNCNSQDFSLDISHDREPVESHTPLNSQIHSQMTNQAPSSISPLPLARADPTNCALLRVNGKEADGRQEKAARDRSEDSQERRSPQQLKSSPRQQSKSRRGSQSPQQLSSPPQTKTPQERKSLQDKIQEIQQRTMEELGLLVGCKAAPKASEGPPVLRQLPEQNQIKPILEEKSQEDDSSRSVRLNVSSLELDGLSNGGKEFDLDEPKKQSQRNSASQRRIQGAEKSSEKARDSGQAGASAREQIQFVQQASTTVLNTVQALERALNQVKDKKAPTPISDDQPDQQMAQNHNQSDIPEQIQTLNSERAIHRSESPSREEQSQGSESSFNKKDEDEADQLKQIIDQFEELSDRRQRPGQGSQQRAAPDFIDENEIDEAINEVLESQSLRYNRDYKSKSPGKDEGDQSESEISLSTERRAVLPDAARERAAPRIEEPYLGDSTEDVKIGKGKNARSSGKESLFQEMERGKLVVETSPRKVHGEPQLDLDRAKRQSPQANRRTSPSAYLSVEANGVGTLAGAAKGHRRLASEVVPGRTPKQASDAAARKEPACFVQKSQLPMAEVLALLNKNQFIKGLGEENQMKLASETSTACFNKNDRIVRFGDISPNYFILRKGKIKVTEYEAGADPSDPNLEDRVALVKYISTEGHGFGEESVKDFAPLQATIDAMERSEFYVMDGFLINEILTKESHERKSSNKSHQRLYNNKRRLSQQETGADEPQMTEPDAHYQRDNHLRPPDNLASESFLSGSESSPLQIRTGSNCPERLGQDSDELDDLLNCDLSAIRQREQPSISASSSSASRNLKETIYASYIETDDHFGLTCRELALFGDRAPKGHKKVRVLGKSHSLLYWVTMNEQGHYYIAQQVPRSLSSFASRVRRLQVEQEFYASIKQKKDLYKYLFSFDGVQSQDGNPDVWQLHRMDQRRDSFKSLYDCLFEVTFDQRMAACKMYDIQHASFYSMVSQRKGHRHLARLIQKICDFLLLLQEAGLVYGNLRPENVMIRVDDQQKEIQSVKFLNFGSVTRIDRAADLMVPDRVEHCPPDLLKALIDLEKFQKGQRLAPEQLRHTKRRICEISESLDVFSLGLIILQITAGCPAMLPLPLRVRCRTAKGQQVQGAALLGAHPADETHSNEHVRQIVHSQESFVGGARAFIAKNDMYNFTKDEDFQRLLLSMLQKDHSKRPTVREVLADRFVKKWTKH